MKKSILIFLLSTLCLVRVHSQLNIEHNRFRPGDMLFKQQVEYVDPGEAGSDKLWNFGKPKIINDEYTLEYAVPPLEYDSIYIMGERRFKKGDVRENELIVGTEHNTMYYYQLKEDSLLQIGHENPSVVLAYTSPMVLLRFPLNYGETVSSDYRSKGLYSGTVDIRTEGTVTVTADAYGKMILPTKDTLDLVLRVKTLQTIFDSREENTGSPEAENTGRQLEIYRWYGKGYRYPVFETMRNLSLPDSSVFFSTAFFFPPQDHFYLETDSANLALLDQLWNLDKENIDHPGEEHTDVVNLKDVLSCKIYPNPVSSILNLEYELKRDAGVSLFMGHEIYHAFQDDNFQIQWHKDGTVGNQLEVERGAVSFENYIRDVFGYSPRRLEYKGLEGGEKGKFLPYSFRKNEESISNFTSLGNNENKTGFGFSFDKKTSKSETQKNYIVVNSDENKKFNYQIYTSEDEYKKSISNW